MLLQLHRLRILLESGDAAIRQQWQALFGSWLQHPTGTADISLRLHLRHELPSLPEVKPFFQDTPAPRDVGVLSVFQVAGGAVLLHFLDGALVEVPLVPHPAPRADGIVVPQAIRHGRLEDITFTSLAPLLRRRGYYLVHAFAASKDGQCILIIGPTRSGKTTTGLALVLAGWELLANDIVLLEERKGEIYALPTPGIVHIRPPTLELLPQLRAFLARPGAASSSYNLSGDAIGNGRWGTPCPISHLCFPFVEKRSHTTLHHQNRAVALARLMGESMDRWDEETLPHHATFLQKLVRQTTAYALHAGQDMAQLVQAMQNA